jgi:hypothetical protein
MQKKRLLIYGMFGLMVFLVSFVILVHALAYAEKREVLLTTSFTIGRQEQKVKAFYLSAPAEGFEVMFNVSSGSIKFSPWQACTFEDSLGYFEYHNGTAVEKRQVWFFEGNNGTAGCSTEDVNQVWYLHFYNEDSYEKEVHIQITKVWHEQNYQSWI